LLLVRGRAAGSPRTPLTADNFEAFLAWRQQALDQALAEAIQESAAVRSPERSLLDVQVEPRRPARTGMMWRAKRSAPAGKAFRLAGELAVAIVVAVADAASNASAAAPREA
jgi:hypothetical protein